MQVLGNMYPSGDDVGQKDILDRRDPVLEDKFAFLEPRHLQLVDETLAIACLGQRHDRDVEIAMFAAEQFQPFAKLLLVQPTSP